VEETNATYMSKFKNAIDVIEHYGGNIGDDVVLVTEELKKARVTPSTASMEEKQTAIKLAKTKAHAMAFLKRADKTRCSLLITDLEDQYTRGNDQYPGSITETYNLLVNHKKPIGRERNPRRPAPGGTPGTEITRSVPPTATTGDEVSFLQNGDAPPIETIQCYNCQKMGHYANSCTNDSAPRQFQLLQTGTIEEIDEEEDNEDDVHFSFTQKNSTACAQIDPN
jgi:hypothetical protein